ncbi:TetR family transcriptional regulator C-terminal domain-containing protein [Dasania marina]|uniref:TetR/AcrR family transcriptional regulator n=1 Tax=Dasania marina TaxID=471499 RepID=UPI0030DAA08C|tara:strand:+ start:21027 stop:21620 length:594 start_codon:yes stop_codon:yes gene_type:complete
MDDLEKSKHLLIESAIRCVAAHGYHKASLRLICDDANLSLGMVRHCFNNKLEMMTAAYQYLSDELLLETNKTIAEFAEDPRSQLEAFIVSGFRKPVFEDDKIMFRFSMWALTRTEPAIAVVHEKLYIRYRKSAKQLFSDLAAKNKIALDTNVAALALTAYLDGLWLEWVVNPKKYNTKAMLAMCMDLVDSYIAGAKS